MIKREKRRDTEKEFRNKFKNYFEGDKDYIDFIRERWTDVDAVILFEYGLRLGKMRGKKK